MENIFMPGARHALDYLGLWLQQSGVRRAHVAATDEAVLQQCLLRLPPTLQAVSLPPDISAPAGVWPWPLVSRPDAAEAMVYPFSLERGAPLAAAPVLVGCFQNALSYRWIVRRRAAALAATALLRHLRRQGYRLQAVIGVYPPPFALWWLLSSLAGARFSPIHFRCLDVAFRHMSQSSGWKRYVSDLVAFYACR